MRYIPSMPEVQCRIVGFLTSFCVGIFSWMFHSTRVHRLPHSPSKKSWTHAYGIYATLMDFLIEPLWCLPLTHTQVHIGKWWLGWDLDLYTLGLGSSTPIFDLPRNAFNILSQQYTWKRLIAWYMHGRHWIMNDEKKSPNLNFFYDTHCTINCNIIIITIMGFRVFYTRITQLKPPIPLCLMFNF
jgi:hypothetical protein